MVNITLRKRIELEIERSKLSYKEYYMVKLANSRRNHWFVNKKSTTLINEFPNNSSFFLYQLR